jgi:hypothetical protein
MSAPISHQPAAAPLKTDQSVQQTNDRKLLSVGSGASFKTPPTIGTLVKTGNPLFKHQTMVITQNALSSFKIFPITFSYLQQLCYTKVLKVVYGPDESIYKVVLRSQVSPCAYVCWLQLRPEGWSLLLGDGLDQQLISAIASAILTQE